MHKVKIDQTSKPVTLIWPRMFVMYSKPTKGIGPKPIYLVSCDGNFRGQGTDIVYLHPLIGDKSTLSISFNQLQSDYSVVESGTTIEVQVCNEAVIKRWKEIINDLDEEDPDDDDDDDEEEEDDDF